MRRSATEPIGTLEIKRENMETLEGTATNVTRLHRRATYDENSVMLHTVSFMIEGQRVEYTNPGWEFPLDESDECVAMGHYRKDALEALAIGNRTQQRCAGKNAGELRGIGRMLVMLGGLILAMLVLLWLI